MLGVCRRYCPLPWHSGHGTVPARIWISLRRGLQWLLEGVSLSTQAQVKGCQFRYYDLAAPRGVKLQSEQLSCQLLAWLGCANGYWLKKGVVW